MITDVKIYEAGDKMITLIRDNYNVLQSLTAFGIPLGFGDATVEETCRNNGVDATTFLAVVNLTINGANNQNTENLSIATLLHYLEACHRYYIDYQLPTVRRELAESINNSDEIGVLILQVYDEYAREIKHHMHYEERTLFPYVKRLIEGNVTANYSINDFEKQHSGADKRLKELIQLIIKYLPSPTPSMPHKEGVNNAIISTLYHIYNNEEWLAIHQMVEDKLFVPMVRKLEKDLKSERIYNVISTFVNADDSNEGEAISAREKEVIVALVQGMSNKEIADHLFISVNTVATHRKNIARKLQIHSPAGLTIYAISNGLVDINTLRNDKKF